MQQWPGVRLFLCFVDNDSQLMTSSLVLWFHYSWRRLQNHPRGRYLTGQKGLMHAKIIHVATLALLTQNKATTLQLLSIWCRWWYDQLHRQRQWAIEEYDCITPCRELQARALHANWKGSLALNFFLFNLGISTCAMQMRANQESWGVNDAACLHFPPCCKLAKPIKTPRGCVLFGVDLNFCQSLRVKNFCSN